jgi:hypothetical protein
MNWQSIIGLISTLALFSPVFVILAFRFIRFKYYLALFIYCLSAFAYNLLTEDYITLPRNIERNFGIINNLLDVPLMLTFLMLFSTSARQIKRMKLLIGVFICYELVVIALHGISVKTITFVMGPGLLLVFGYALYFFVQTVKRSFVHTKAISKAMMVSAICFAYGCFFFIYIMHYVLALPGVPEIFLLYFIVTIIYCSLLTVGLVLESRRIRKLEELLITRKELISFFEEEKKTVIRKESTGQWKLNQSFNNNISSQ